MAATVAASGIAVAATVIWLSHADFRRFLPILVAVGVTSLGVAIAIPVLMAGSARNAVLIALAAVTIGLSVIGSVRTKSRWLSLSLLLAAAVGIVVLVGEVAQTLASSSVDT